MKYVKMLGLLAVAASALMAFAGTASATEVTSSTGSTPTIHAVSVGHATLHNAVGKIECNSTVAGAVTTHSPTETVIGAITTLTFTNCTNGSVHQVEGKVAQPGTLELHKDPEAGSPTGNGTLTSSGAKVPVTLFGVECGYTTSGTDIGTVVTGEHAVLKIKATINRTFGSALCGATGNWTGEYKLTHPTFFAVH